MSNVTNTKAFPGLIRSTYLKIKIASADGAYDRRVSHDKLRRKKIMALIPPRSRSPLLVGRLCRPKSSRCWTARSTLNKWYHVAGLARR
ncbi:MAG: hypothetical protein G5663_01640 [Serratia symbiotica]|nr:hypothetical protein [Serratia symbiotica]